MAWENFTELNVYKKNRAFRKKISTLIKTSFPKEEKFRLTNQIIRSSRSITASIAEGHGRFHYQENIQYCRIARGSLSETLEHLVTAFDEAYITEDSLLKLKTEFDTCMKLMNGYIKYLEGKKKK